MVKPLGLSMEIQTSGLISLQQLVLGKFRVSSVARFELRIMYHLLRPHFPVFALTNWATLTGPYHVKHANFNLSNFKYKTRFAAMSWR